MWEQVDDVLDEVREQLQFRNVKSAEKLRQAFEHGDVDGSGALDTLELEECLSHAGVFMEKRKLNLLVRALDCNGDKRVQYEEFMQAFLVCWPRAAARDAWAPDARRGAATARGEEEGDRGDSLARCFRRCGGGAGRRPARCLLRRHRPPRPHGAPERGRRVEGVQPALCRGDWSRCAWLLGERRPVASFAALTGPPRQPTAAVRESAFTDYYTDVSNGILHDDEFVALLEGTWHVREHEEEAEAEELQELQSRLYDGLLSKNDGVEQPAKTLRRIFAFFDTDGSGALSRTEFAAALERVGLYLRPRQCDGARLHQGTYHLPTLSLSPDSGLPASCAGSLLPPLRHRPLGLHRRGGVRVWRRAGGGGHVRVHGHAGDAPAAPAPGGHVLSISAPGQGRLAL